MEDVPVFVTPDEEIQFWKSKAETYQTQAKEAKEEFLEFQVDHIKLVPITVG
jgi:hypothetical protein